MWLMLQQDSPDDFIIATGRTSSLKDFVQIVFAGVGLDWSKYVRTRPELLRPTDIKISRANPEKAYRVLGWEARHTIEDVARMMVASEMVLLN
jgi:GDPmannose 4,6-dehydratase